MKRSPLLPSRRALPARSRKRRAEEVERAKTRKEVLTRDGFVCRLAGWSFPSLPGVGPHRCFGGLECHHIRKASAGGAYTPDVLVVVCQHGNQFVEDWPTWAHNVGLVQRQGETLADAWQRLYVAGLSSSPEPGSAP